MTRLHTYISSDNNNNHNNVSDWNALIDDEYIRTFCFNIHNVDVITCRRIPKNSDTEPALMSNNSDDDMNNKNTNDDDDIGQEISMLLDDYTENDVNEDVQIPFLWYICYEACQLFHQHEHRYPGTSFPINDDDNGMIGFNEEDEAELLWLDAKQLQSYIVQTLQQDPKYAGLETHPVIQRTLLQPHTIMNDSHSSNETSTPMSIEEDNNNDTSSSMIHDHPSKYAIEMVRYGNGEIHTIASIVGGIAAQEMMKIITYQYVPMNNTYVYNGITSTGAVYTV